MSDSGSVEYADMQALLRFGHGHLPESLFVLLKVADASAACAWLRSASISSAEKHETLPDKALQVAISGAGMRALGLDDAIIDEFSPEFAIGMSGDSNRSRRLGDVGANRPENWIWGGPATGVPHLLLLLYTRLGQLDAWWNVLRDASFRRAFTVSAELTATMNSDREHFGFVDGISQPSIDWSGRMRTGPHERDAYSNDLAVGEVVLGYENEYGLYTDRPLLHADSCDGAGALPAAEDDLSLRDLGRNGSYLVMRQLAQDVAGFWRYVDEAARGNKLDRERLAAYMVGRERSNGRPLVSSSGLNGFDFADDPHGRACPVGAHVRRANPRTGDFPPGVRGMLTRLIRTLGFARRYHQDDLVAASRFHRLLRRGRVYGDAVPVSDALLSAPGEFERGLHFISLGASISRQFEFVQNAWIESTHFAGLQNESDPLLGNRETTTQGMATNEFSYRDGDAPAIRLRGLPQFVKLLGGAYFFMPGLRALHFIARERE